MAGWPGLESSGGGRRPRSFYRNGLSEKRGDTSSLRGVQVSPRSSGINGCRHRLGWPTGLAPGNGERQPGDHQRQRSGKT